MLCLRGAWRSLSYAIGLVLFVAGIAQAQEQSTLVSKPPKPRIVSENAETVPTRKSLVIHSYFDPVQGTSANEIVRRALAANGELAAARLEIERAQARLRQAGLRPNPTIDVEQSIGRFTGSAGESEVSVGIAVPIELGGKRTRRIELARAELEASQAEVADRERRLTNEVRALYAEALASIRELSTLEELNDLDLQTTRFVQARVNEGETAPIELNQLRVEVERLRSRRALVEGRLKGTLLRLKSLTGIGPTEILRLGEDLQQPLALPSPASVDAAVEIALRSRPDLRFAKLSEDVAQAGLQLARAQAVPNLTPFTKYSNNRSVFEDTPVGVLRDRDKSLTFGVSIEIPIFNRNQGGKAEAAVAINQAQRRREFLEAVIRSEVQSAFARYEAAQVAVTTFEQGAIPRSSENVRTIRAAYQIGAFSITDLLVEQRRLLDVQREFTEALAERYRALADLQAAMGIPVVQQ